MHPPVEAAEAAEAGSYGTLIIKQRGGYVAGFHVTFYSFFGENLGEYDTGNLAIGETREFKIPKNTYRVHVYVAIWAGNKKDIDFYADESAVNENSRIELTSEKTSKHPRFDVKINNGWSETAECPHRGIIQFNSVARGLFGGASFKATFYKDDQKLGEESLDLSNYLREAIKIPDNTNRIEAAISGAKWEWSSEIYDSATLKLDGNKATSMDVITINFGDRFRDWAPMEITCPNWWKLSERGSIQFKSYFNADNPNMYFKATFYKDDCQIGEKSVKLSHVDVYSHGSVVDSETIKIPNDTTVIKTEIIKDGTPIDSATLEYDPAKNPRDDIKIRLGMIWGAWDSMEITCPNGWGRSESTKKMSSGTIQLNNNFVADHPDIYFEATLYRDDQKLGEEHIHLCTLDELRAQERRLPYGKTFGISVGTTSVKVEIIKEGKPIDSATFELRRDKTFSEDAIKIDLGYGDGRKGWWKSMEFNYPECWQKIK